MSIIATTIIHIYFAISNLHQIEWYGKIIFFLFYWYRIILLTLYIKSYNYINFYIPLLEIFPYKSILHFSHKKAATF